MNKKGTRALTSLFNFENKKFCPKSKRSQLTIFIIIAIFIIAAVVSFFLLREKVPIKIGGGAKAEAPQSFLEICLEDKVKEGIKIISSQGGSISNPLNKSFKFKDEEKPTDISYLCYTRNYYISCVNQEPMLIQHLEYEIKNYINNDVESCFNDLVKSLRKQNYVVESKYNGFEVRLEPKKVVVNISAELILTKTEETSKQEEFKVIFPSRLYEIAYVAQEITSQEARFCNFEYLGYMTLYPQLYIDKFTTSDAVIIYTIMHKDTKEKFRFAIRTCVMPPGFG